MEGNSNTNAGTAALSKKVAKTGDGTMAGLLLLSILFASTNTLLYKITLNAYSSPTTNYAFFTAQFSILLYFVNAVILTVIVAVRDPVTWSQIREVPWKIFVNMGLLDAACGTLSAIAGARCPGEMQTILNQTVIPITMVGAAFFLHSQFQSFQIWGSIFIVVGAVVASSDYLFGSGHTDDDTESDDFYHHHNQHQHHHQDDGTATHRLLLTAQTEIDSVSDSRLGMGTGGPSTIVHTVIRFLTQSLVDNSNSNSNSELESTEDPGDVSDMSGGIGDSTASKVTTAMVSVAIIVYFISQIPSAFSNIYKEARMKEYDMDEWHTSTIVSFWQLVLGFAFLPLMALPALGGLTVSEMSSQLGDGFICFWDGKNPKDPTTDNCQHAALYLIAYIVVNFFYNILLLKITKQGSAVLLVISQALSLPVTNIAFTLRVFMGDEAEPLTIVDLVGLVLVCIGFLTYSGYGFANNFMVAQAAPGQLSYLHFEDLNEVIVSTDIALNPDELVSFLLGSILQQSLQQAERNKHHHHKSIAQTVDESKGKTSNADAADAAKDVELAARNRSADYGSSSGDTNTNASANAAASSSELDLEQPAPAPAVDLHDVQNSSSSGIVANNLSLVSSSTSAPLTPPIQPSPLTACETALDIARRTVRLLEAQYEVLQAEATAAETPMPQQQRPGTAAAGIHTTRPPPPPSPSPASSAAASPGLTNEEVLRRLNSLTPRLKREREQREKELLRERSEDQRALQQTGGGGGGGAGGEREPLISARSSKR